MELKKKTMRWKIWNQMDYSYQSNNNYLDMDGWLKNEIVSTEIIVTWAPNEFYLR